MTEEASTKKIIPKSNLYPKSNRSNIAKLQYNIKNYEPNLRNADYFAFGDSFVNMFLHAENSFYIKIKGKSVKGLAKKNDEDRIKIEKWIKATPKHVTIIFNFGQVDLNFVRYYKLTKNQLYADQTFQQYIDWIDSLNRKCIVFGIFASPIDSENIVETLQKYGTLQGVEIEDSKILQLHQKTEDTRKQWNDIMEQACQKSKSIRFINLFPYHQEIPEKFLDQNPKTIHLRYLPTIMEVAKHVLNIKINLKRSLEIQNQYVDQKTKRYQRNLEILEDRKGNESLQSESQSRKSSKDAYDEQYSTQHTSEKFDTQSDTFERQGKSSDEEYMSSKEYLQEKQENQRFIDLLGIEGIDSPEKLFQNIRKPNNAQLLWKLADRIIEVGICWVNIERFDCCTVNFFLINSLTLIKDVTDAQSESSSDEMPFQKIIRSKLQEYFEKNLLCNDKTRVIEDVITLIVYFYLDQKTFGLAILPEKLLFLVLKQILLSVFRRIVSSSPEQNDGVVADFNCFYKLKYEFQERMNEIFQKQNSKNKINEPEFYSKFLELLLCKNLEGKKLESKVSELEKLLNEDFPYAIYSPKVSEELLKIFNIELDFHEFRKSLKISQKYLLASQENTISQMKQRLLKMREQLTKSLKKINEDSDVKIKTIEEQICNKCGSLNNLVSPTKKQKNGKGKK